jgi:hypothetical protein
MGPAMTPPRKISFAGATMTTARLLAPVLVVLVAGCATPHAALKSNPNGPEIIYAIPQSQAFAIAREAILSAAPSCGADGVQIKEIRRGDGIRGYEADYDSLFYRFFIQRHLYVIPTAGSGASGQQIDGFRFEITYFGYLGWMRGWMPLQTRLPGGGCEKTLAGALLASLSATRTATSVTSVEIRPYGEDRGRSSTSR